jgi:hypothetical protein
VRCRQPLGLLLQQLFDGAFGQPLGGRAGDILHSRQIDIQPRSIGPEGVAGDDFSPLFGDRANRVQIRCTQAACSHGWFFLELEYRNESEFPSSSI